MNIRSNMESAGKKQTRDGRRRSFFRRLKLALPCACLLCFTFLFFGPYETVALNTASFSYHHSSIILPLLLTALCASLLLTLTVSLMRGKFFYAAVSAIFSTALCIYLQAAFFNGTLTILTGDAVDWAAQKPQMLVNLAVWILVYAAVFSIMLLRRKAFRSIVIYASLLLIFMQTVPVIGILLGAYEGTQKKESSAYTLQSTGLYEFSKEHNVLVFVLDRMDYDYVKSSLDQKPDMLDFLDGFVWYDNATSVYIRTEPALSHILTGNTELAYCTPSEEFYSKSWNSSGRKILEDIHAQDYSIELYSKIDYLFSKPQTDAQHVLNLSAGDEKLLPVNLVKRMLMLSCYRFLPISAKPYFFKDTNYYNADVFASEPYELNDGKNGAGFVGIEASRTSNSFKFIHFMGSHAPYFLTASGTPCDYPTSAVEQTTGCFALLEKAFDRMKELGIYENATIIITADHGSSLDALTDQKKTTHPRIGLFYKEAGSADTPLKISSAPVSTQNISATILKAMGAPYSAYGPALDDVAQDAEVTRVHYKINVPEETGGTNSVQIYHITGHAADMDSWKPVEYYEYPAAHRLH